MPSGTKVKLWFIEPTAAARKYSRIPKSRNPGKADIIYVPLSLIEHTTKFEAEEDEYPVHVITVPDWFVSKNNL